MAEVIDIFTRQKWKRPSAPGRGKRSAAGSARNNDMREEPRRFDEWEQIGLPAGRVVGRLGETR